MNVAIVKYNAGNIYSVVHALQRLGIEPVLTDDADLLRRADKVIFPGQGEASNAMRYLRERGLDEVIRSLTNPLLGICIGQQLLCRHSEEGNVDCLGIFDADVLRFRPERHEDKVPHMGWNRLNAELTETSKGEANNSAFCVDSVEPNLPHSALLNGVYGKYVYFVHSYYVPVCQHTIATTDYILPFSAALQRDNFFATQFHPEKSGSVGEQILKNFLFHI